MTLRRNWKYYNDNWNRFSFFFWNRFSNLITRTPSVCGGCSRRKRKIASGFCSNTHTHTRHFKEEGVMIPKEKVKRVSCGFTVLKTFYQKIRNAPSKLMSYFVYLLLAHLRYHYFVTIHNLIDLTWFKSNQTGPISTSTFWEN